MSDTEANRLHNGDQVTVFGLGLCTLDGDPYIVEDINDIAVIDVLDESGSWHEAIPSIDLS